IDVRRAVADPAHDARTNVEGTVNVLEAARVAGTGRVVFSSTGGAIYGEADELPTAEDAAIRPLSPYGQSKFAGEGYLALYARLHGLSTISLRYSNAYGPRQDPLGEGGVAAIFCGKLERGERPTVFGDGLQTRDYVYVGDIVRANLRAAELDVVGTFNIGTGVETTVLQLAEQLAADAAATASFEPLFEPERAGEVRRSCLAAGRAREVLGWSAETDLASGLRQTLAHVRDDAAVA
ncbi:MAG TPA: NAD-dependent epimerase/dehydratase family protein, partial [Conexibacter sp.]|nr:NAD-dependent epimerase/dehydratase family protein [Conexibacter sp.]